MQYESQPAWCPDSQPAWLSCPVRESADDPPVRPPPTDLPECLYASFPGDKNTAVGIGKLDHEQVTKHNMADDEVDKVRATMPYFALFAPRG